MSSNLVLVIACDHPKCRKTCGSVPGIYKDVWRNAKVAGWIHKKEYDLNNIGRDAHFCPDHAEKHR